MKSEIEPKPENALPDDRLQMSSPLSSQALFWSARYRSDSDFLYHMPLAFWLTDVSRPATFVELGVDDGQSYFGFCQAMERLNMAGRCYGFSEAPVDEALLAYNSDNYDDFSALAERSAVRALRRFEEGVIDFLVVNMALPEETLKTLSDIWARKLSDSGVLLLYNYLDEAREDLLQELIEKLSGKPPLIRFDKGSGLTVVLFGSQQDVRLKQMAGIKFGTPEYNIVQSVFGRLGSSHYHEWNSGKFAKAAADAQKKAAQALADLEEQAQTLVSAQEELTALKAAYDARNEKVSEMQTALFDLRQEQIQTGTTLRDRNEALQAAETARDKAEAAATRAGRDAETAQAVHTNEIVSLTQRLREVEERAAIAGDTARREAAETAQAQLEELKAALQATEAARDKAVATCNEAGEETAALQTQLEGLKAALQAAETARDKAVQEKDALKEDRSTRFQELKQLTSLLQQEKQKTESLTLSQNRQIAELKRLHEDQKTKHQESRKELAELAERTAYDNRYREIQVLLRERLIERLQSQRYKGLAARRVPKSLKEEAGIVSRSSHFDAQWYLDSYSDVRESRIDPALHFVSKGLYEGRSPSPDFDCIAYYITYPEALQNDINPLVHAAKTGADT